ncbi:MAG: ATP-binding protein [Sphingomonas sp.]
MTNQRYRFEQQADAETQAAVVAASTVAALDFGDRQSAAEYLSALSANPRVVRAELRDRAGTLFVAYQRPGVSAGEATTSGSAPVLRDGEAIGRVTLMETLDPWWRRLSRYSLIVLLGICTALVVAVLAMGQAALARANDHLSQRATALADANAALATEIAERARAEEELRQAQKMQALGQLTGGIAHDFNNLLTVVRGTADLLRRPGLAEARRIRYAESIAQTAERATQLTSQLLAFSRRQPLQPKVIDLNTRLQGMLMMFTRVLGHHYEVTTDFDPDLCHVKVDPTQLQVAVLNLVVNARDAMGEGGSLSIATSRWPGKGEDEPEDPAQDRPAFAAISITDNGIGMDAETVARATEPFFTTKTVGKGTGLGLSQVYGFAVQSGGTLEIDSVPGQGTTMRLTLPCTDLPVEACVESGVVDNGWRGQILFVEDNVEVAAFSRTLLEELGHGVLYAQSAEAALELTERGAHFDFVFSDIVMPGMSGFDLAEQIQRLRPGIPILLATGYSDRLNDQGSAGLPILTKPYSLDELATAISKAAGENPDSTPGAKPGP